MLTDEEVREIEEGSPCFRHPANLATFQGNERGVLSRGNGEMYPVFYGAWVTKGPVRSWIGRSRSRHAIGVMIVAVLGGPDPAPSGGLLAGDRPKPGENGDQRRDPYRQ